MAGQGSMKVRRVRCPGCRKVLEEPPDVVLYKCGGCGNILQAKNRKLESDCDELSANSVVKSQAADVLEEKEVGTVDHGNIGPPSLESSPDKDSTRGVPDVMSSLPAVACPNEDSCMEDKELLKQDNLGGRLSEGCNGEFHDDVGGSSNGITSSGKFTQEVEVYVPETIEHVERHNTGRSCEDDKEGEESQGMWQEGDELGDDVQSVVPLDSECRVRNERNTAPPENEDMGQTSLPDQKQDSEGGIKLAEQSIVADAGGGGFPMTTSSENIASVGRSNSVVANKKSLNERLVPCYPMCPGDEHPPREGTRDFGKTSAVDTFRSLAQADLTSELNLKHEPLVNHPTAGGYYAYAGSEPAYDGIHCKIGARMPSRKCRGVDYPRTAESLRKGAFTATSMNSEPEGDYRISSTHRATRSSLWHREKYSGTTGYASENHLRGDRQGVVSSQLRASRDPLTQHNLLPPRPGRLSSSSKALYSEVDRTELLRTIYDLKDQLNRVQLPKVTSNRMFPDRVEDRMIHPFNYDRLAVEHDADPNCPVTYSRHDQEKICPSRCKYDISRMAFSGKAAHHRRHISCSSPHCCPSNWHYSSAELSRSGCETMYNNLRLNEMKRLHLQEKNRVAKRYMRSVAGAAPFITCYHCRKLLHLPADFLIFEKRYHRLMCNACKRVLKFSLVQGTHIVPYIPEASTPMPTEANGYSRSVSRSWSTRGEAMVGLATLDKNESSMKAFGSVGTSLLRISTWRKSTSEIKEAPPSLNRRLHHLMGYKSPSQILD